MNRTKIEWVQNPDGTPGYTWNPITGCLKGCEYCYARKLANGRLKSRMLANKNHAPTPTTGDAIWQVDPFFPRFWTERLYHPFYGKPRGVFVCSLADLFGEGVPEDWTRWVLDLCRMHDQNRYYLLTKQPQNLAKWSPFPDNCWVGVSMTGPETLGTAVYHLKDVEAHLKYLSFEPLLRQLRCDRDFEARMAHFIEMAGINWVIIGAQSKPYIAPKVEWVSEIVEAADKAGIPVFLKDSLKSLVFSDPLFAEGMVNWAGELRQEMPK